MAVAGRAAEGAIACRDGVTQNTCLPSPSPSPSPSLVLDSDGEQ